MEVQIWIRHNFDYCWVGENFLLYPSWVLVAGLIIKLTQDRLTEEKELLLCAHKGLIEMGPKK